MFKTTVMRYVPLPRGRLFLRYPIDAVTKFRQTLRVDAQISFRLEILDKLRVVSVPCVIRTIKGKLLLQMSYGIAFDEQIDEAVLLTSKSFCYDPLVER